MPEHTPRPNVRHDAPTTPSEIARLSEIVSRVVIARRAIARAQAEEARALADAGELSMTQMARIDSPLSRDREMPLRTIAAELASATRQSERTVRSQIDDASVLTDQYPATFAAWEQGHVSRSHVAAVLDVGAVLASTDARPRFDRIIAESAGSQTPAQLRATGRILAERLHPRTLTERHVDARSGRSVRVFDLPDGMSELITVQPTLLAHAIHDRLTRQAQAVKSAERALRGCAGRAEDAGSTGNAATSGCDDRTIDQIRADLLADMLLTTAPTVDATPEHETPGGLGAIRATVQVTVPVTTLAGTTRTPAVLDGRRPVDPATARVLAGHATGWDRVLTHPITGAVLTVDRYRPSEHLRRLLRARDQHCRFPGCRAPAHRCDLDHTVDAARGGPTDANNLGHLCRGHHSLKHATPWKVRQLTGGTFQWTSPTGRVYTDRPAGVTFAPGEALDDHDPPPW